jgi:hypothetical protein
MNNVAIKSVVPATLHSIRHEVIEQDLRGMTVWRRFVGQLDLNIEIAPSVTVVGGWRRSEPHAFASFLEALAEVTKIKVQQAFRDDGTMRPPPDDVACVVCLRMFADVKAGRSTSNCDTCADCDRSLFFDEEDDGESPICARTVDEAIRRSSRTT